MNNSENSIKNPKEEQKENPKEEQKENPVVTELHLFPKEKQAELQEKLLAVLASYGFDLSFLKSEYITNGINCLTQYLQNGIFDPKKLVTESFAYGLRNIGVIEDKNLEYKINQENMIWLNNIPQFFSIIVGVAAYPNLYKIFAEHLLMITSSILDQEKYFDPTLLQLDRAVIYGSINNSMLKGGVPEEAYLRVIRQLQARSKMMKIGKQNNVVGWSSGGGGSINRTSINPNTGRIMTRILHTM